MNLRGSLLVFFLLILGFMFTSVRVFSSEYKVGEIAGLTYNEVWQQWFDQGFSMWVYVVKDVEMIGFTAETGVGKAIVFLRNTDDNLSGLKKAVSKSIEWSDIAITNQADVSKELGCFGKCEDDALGFKKGRITLTFFASNGGTQTNLILEIIHYDNMFIKTSIYMDLDDMKKFQGLIADIPSSFVKVHKKAEKEKLFK